MQILATSCDGLAHTAPSKHAALTPARDPAIGSSESGSWSCTAACLRVRGHRSRAGGIGRSSTIRSARSRWASARFGFELSARGGRASATPSSALTRRSTPRRARSGTCAASEARDGVKRRWSSCRGRTGSAGFIRLLEIRTALFQRTSGFDRLLSPTRKLLFDGSAFGLRARSRSSWRPWLRSSGFGRGIRSWTMARFTEHRATSLPLGRRIRRLFSPNRSRLNPTTAAKATPRRRYCFAGSAGRFAGASAAQGWVGVHRCRKPARSSKRPTRTT